MLVIEIQKQSKVSLIVFVFTLIVVGISLVSLFFPALLVPITTEYESIVEPFSPGRWALPALITYMIIFYLGLAYYAKKLPKIILNSFQFILNFEISRRLAILAVVIILGGYIAFTVQDLTIYEGSEFGDYDNIKKLIEDFPSYRNENVEQVIVYVKNFLLFSSLEIFQNVRVIPFIGSTSLLLLTYLFTAKIANKRFAGIVAMVVLLQSYTFLKYDVSATYSSFWTLFYLLSLYMIYKRWYLSPVLFVLSIFSKPLVVAFFPMTLFFTYRIQMPRRKKFYILLSYGIIIGALIGVVLFTDVEREKEREILKFESVDLWIGFTTWAFQLRFDGFFLLFFLPVIVGLYMISRKGVRDADSILLLLGGILIASPLMAAFSGFNIQPYRFIPLIVFFAVGVGTLLSKKIIQQA